MVIILKIIDQRHLIFKSAIQLSHQILREVLRVCMSENYELIRNTYLSEFNCHAKLYEHKKHKFHFLHLDATDSNNTFDLIVRLPSLNDSGENHVLEHLVLSSSAKFQTFDTFSLYDKRTFCNVMNAVTTNTCIDFVFSTLNETDFFNTLSVYLDLIFDPLFNEYSFLSECHRLEFLEQENIESELKHCGVVYNEMCGDISSSDTFFSYYISRYLLPDTPLRYFSGGFPDKISDITLDRIKEVYNRFFIPSNMYFYHYGSFDNEKVFTMIEEYVSKFEYKVVDYDFSSMIQKRWDKEKLVIRQAPADPGADLDEVKINYSWLLPDYRDIALDYDLTLFSFIVFHSESSSFYQKLVKSQLCSYIDDYFPDRDNCNFTFGLSVFGVDKDDVGKVRETVFSEFKRIVKEGFTDLQIKGGLHSMEIRLRQKYDNTGYGLISDRVQGDFHDYDIIDDFLFEDNLKKLKERVRQKGYIEKVFDENVLKNNSFLELIVRPIQDFNEYRLSRMKEKLKEKQEKMTDEEKMEIVEQSKKIKEFFSTKYPSDILPSFRKSDLDVEGRKFSYDMVNNNTIAVFKKPTSKIAYITLRSEVNLNSKHIVYLPIFTDIFTIVGCNDLIDRKYLYTMRISSNTSVNYSKDRDKDEPRVYITVKTSFLYENVDDALSVLKDYLFSPDFSDKEQIKSFLNENYTQMIDSFVDEIDDYAAIISSSMINRYAFIMDLLKGFQLYKEAKRLFDKGDYDFVIEEIKCIYNDIFRKGVFDCIVCCEGDFTGELTEKLSPIINKLNESSEPDVVNSEDKYKFIDELMGKVPKFRKKFIKVDSSSNCTYISLPSIYVDHPLSHASAVLGNLLECGFLLEEARNKLGAYGVEASFQSAAGIFTIGIINENNSDRSLEIIEGALKYVVEEKFTDEDIEHSIIKEFSIMETPTEPHKEDISFYVNGTTYEESVRYRQDLYDCSREDIVELAEYLLSKRDEWIICVIGTDKYLKNVDDFDIETV